MLLGFGAPVQVGGGKLQEAPLHLAAKIKEGKSRKKFRKKSQEKKGKNSGIWANKYTVKN